MLAAFGAVLILIGIIFQIVQLVVRIRDREELRDDTGDPWDGRSLEWATSSPPPVFNFAVLPDVPGEDAYWAQKVRARQAGAAKSDIEYRPIEMPRNSPTGFVCAFFATIMGFAHDLAHLVDGDRRSRSARSRPSWCSPGATMTNTRFRPTKSRASIARTSVNARDMVSAAGSV